MHDQSYTFYFVVKEWAKRYTMGQDFLESDACPRRSVELMMEDKVALVKEIVLSEGRGSVRNDQAL